MKRTSIIIAAAAIISAFVAAPASAATWGGRTETVAYGDLNLNSESGARAMVERINQAARVACFDHSGPMPLSERNAIRACRADAASTAVNTLGAPMVTALYYGREPNIIIASR